MSFDDTASQLGISTSAIEQLLNGYATEGMAEALGTSSSAIQKFINGQGSDSIAETIGVNSSELQHIRNKLDTSGSIGFILGLAYSAAK
jgi:transcriptional regulator with XRE-family HTH domain